MKHLALILLLPLKLFSQDITGLWVGTLYNDTTQTSLHYELAIGEQNGKFTAYSYTTFILDNQELVGVKSIKVVKTKENFFFEDLDLLYNNYPFAPPKGIRQISSLSYKEADSIKTLTGKFITTRSKQYGRQVTGTINLERKKEFTQEKLITALADLGLTNTLSFIPKMEQSAIAAANIKKPVEKNRPVIEKKVEKEKKKQPIAMSVKEPVKTINPLEELAKRKVETIETVFYSGDSLKLDLYDNGFVDGDSISLIVNGIVLMEHQRLSQQAISKTISTITTNDSLNIIMYAENLGSIAPNSGLLVIHDGEKRYEVRFSGDLQKNAAIVLKRKKR